MLYRLIVSMLLTVRTQDRNDAQEHVVATCGNHLYAYECHCKFLNIVTCICSSQVIARLV